MKPAGWLGTLMLLIAFAPSAHALRCGSDLTHAGDYEFQVRTRCGEPFWSESHYRVESFGNKDVRVEREIQYTDWYYNFGTSQFMVRMTFRDGQLTAEEKLGRGVDEIGAGCDGTRLLRGWSSGELVAYCGEPVQRYEHYATVAHRVAHHAYAQDEDVSEDWIYDFGGDLVYVAHLINGRVGNVEGRRR
jgi:hypothetical protein